MLLDSAERFARDVGALENRDTALKGGEAFSRERWQSYAELGWLALTTPEEYGGVGGSCADLIVLMQGLGPALLLEPIVASSILAASVIERAAAWPSREDLLRQMAGGSTIVTLVHNEASTRHAAQSVVARRSGKHYRLSGNKVLCWHAPTADKLLVTARLEEDTAQSILMVDRHARGVTLTPYSLLDDTQAADIVFDDVIAEETAVLIDASKTAYVLERAVDRATVALAAEAVGMMKHVMLLTSEHLKTRVQFGQPLSRFQALQHRIAEMFVSYQDAVSILHHAAEAVDEDVADARRAAVSAAKVVIGEAGRYIGGQGIQLHGAIGVTAEHRVGRFYRRFLMFSRTFGDADFHLDRYHRNRLEGQGGKSR